MPWLRQLVTDISLRRAGFTPGSVHVGFVVDKVAFEQFFLRVVEFSPVNIISPWHSMLIYHLEVNIRPVCGCSSETSSHVIDINNNVTANL
jgi:hypothetical protein